jgi:hypothetical protein
VAVVAAAAAAAARGGVAPRTIRLPGAARFVYYPHEDMSPGPALFTDLHQLTMAAGYFRHGLHEKRVSFELFVRRLPARSAATSASTCPVPALQPRRRSPPRPCPQRRRAPSPDHLGSLLQGLIDLAP